MKREIPVFEEVKQVHAIFDPATAEEGKFYMRLCPIEETAIYTDLDDDDNRVVAKVRVLGALCVVDHTGKPIEGGIVATIDRNVPYNMALELSPMIGIRKDLHIRRGDAGSMHVDFNGLKPRLARLFQ